MAELVDALVSNTNAARRTGSSPVLGTLSSKKVLTDISFVRTFSLYKHAIPMQWRANECCEHRQ